ncbi:unnamed protein product, partial [Medioppia subpectinata]
MPERGPEARAAEFDGRRPQLSAEFIEILDEFCRKILAPERLTPKMAGGRPLTGRAFSLYIKVYVDMFNSGQIQGCDMLEALSKITDHNLIKQIKDDYQLKLQDLISDERREGRSRRELTVGADSLRDECRQTFETQKKSANDRTVRELREVLATTLTETTGRALDEYDRRRAVTAERVIGDLVDQFKATIGPMGSGHEYYGERQFETIVANKVDELTAEFELFCLDDDELLAANQDKFKNQIDFHGKAFMEENRRRIQGLKELYDSEVTRLKTVYDQTMGDLFTDAEQSYHPDDLDTLQTTTTGDTLTQLNQYTANTHAVSIEPYKTALDNYCWGKYTDYMEKNGIRRERAEVDAREELRELCDDYEQELERLIELGAAGADTFDEFRPEARAVGQRMVAERRDRQPPAGGARRPALNMRDVSARFAEILADSQYIFLEKKRKEGLVTEQLLDAVLKTYTERMARHREDTAYIKSDRLDQIHGKLCDELLAEFDHKRQHLTMDKFADMVNELLARVYDSVRDDNDKNTPTLPAIGIDLGTTNSCVAYYKPDKLRGEVIVFKNDRGHFTTPSVVEYKAAEQEVIVGDVAKENQISSPRQTLYSIKRLIGRKYSSDEVTTDRKHWPFRVIDMGQDEPGLEVETSPGKIERFMPEEVSAQVLKKMKETAEQRMSTGDERVVIENCVITVPAYFNDAQREATIGAATMAGLHVLHIMNEPTAAALAYQSNRFDDLRTRTVLIYDFGGGTFDVSILALEGCDVNVLATHGNNHLGGDDVDNNMMTRCWAEFERQTGQAVDVRTDAGAVAQRRLKRECERQKWDLSETNSARVTINNFFDNNHLDVELTRKDFNTMNAALFASTMDCVNIAMGIAGKTPRDIDDVILVGGSTRIPYVREMLADEFLNKNLCQSIDPDLAVAEGAAIQAAILNGNQAQQLGKLRVLDVTPYRLGVAKEGDQFSEIVEAQSSIPCSRSKTYRTVQNGQTSIDVEVYEGNEAVASANRHLGRFTVSNIPPGPAGEHTIQIIFDIDDDGILKVRALNLSTGQTAGRIEVVKHSGRLTAQELQERAI